MREIWLGRGPSHTYCNIEDIFIVRTRVLFFKALIRGQCHVFKLLAKDLAGVSERWYNPRTAPST